MEENVALDAARQKKFAKSIKGIKKLIKKKADDPEVADGGSDKVKTGRVGKKGHKKRGLVYLSHIPHGFYENEMTQYFKQFGVVTNSRVIKSKRTGRSKGYGFVEFLVPAVGEIVAETMNNYLMGKRLIKAAYIPPEKQRKKVFRKNWNSVNNPGNNLRMKMKKAHNENKDEKGELQRAKKLLSNINKTKQKLKELGINYDFFTPVDIPDALNVQVKSETDDNTEKIAKNSDSKQNKKGKKVDSKIVVNKKEQLKDSKVDKTAKAKFELVSQDKTKKNKKVEVDKKTLKKKEQNLKDKGVTPMQDFIKVQEDEDDSSNDEFDSDAYEELLQKLDESELSCLSSEDDMSDGEDVDDSEEDLPKPKIKKNKAVQKAPLPVKGSKALKQKTQTKLPGPPQKSAQPSQEGKRKVQQSAPKVASPKKPKFEKQTNQKTRSKQFKKKK